ncbi:MAG TPA: zinc-ribbon domain-containing protein, partial [Candidatus Acidoferrum sp.]|nr:zinc-ribbon domain-containing protein [Candidatus Acidoferrum sp.]
CGQMMRKGLYSVRASHMTRRIGVSLVYCVRCGAKNPDDATVCAQCGKPLMGVERGRTRHEEEMCFGMPHHWGSILVGLFIIVLGLSILFQSLLAIQFWPLVLIFIGIAVLLGGLYRYSRR